MTTMNDTRREVNCLAWANGILSDPSSPADHRDLARYLLADDTPGASRARFVPPVSAYPDADTVRAARIAAGRQAVYAAAVARQAAKDAARKAREDAEFDAMAAEAAAQSAYEGGLLPWTAQSAPYDPFNDPDSSDYLGGVLPPTSRSPWGNWNRPLDRADCLEARGSWGGHDLD